MNVFIQSDIQESERIMKYLAGERHNSPAFLSPIPGINIPCPSALFAITYLGPEYQIDLTNYEVKNQGNYHTAHAKCERMTDWFTVQSRIGAGISKHPIVARYFAWANAIRKSMLTEELIRERINHS